MPNIQTSEEQTSTVESQTNYSPRLETEPNQLGQPQSARSYIFTVDSTKSGFTQMTKPSLLPKNHISRQAILQSEETPQTQDPHNLIPQVTDFTAEEPAYERLYNLQF